MMLLNKKEMAACAGVSIRSLELLVAAGKLPSVQIGTRRLFVQEDVIQALKSGVAAPGNGGLRKASPAKGKGKKASRSTLATK